MYTTRYSLMEGVKDRRNAVAWQEFYDLYQPLIYRYGRQRGLNHSDSEEVVAQCFALLASAMPKFQYSRTRGRFKSWLKKLVNHRISHLLAARREGPWPGAELAAPGDGVHALWEQAWRQEVLHHCIELARAEVSRKDFEVFRLNVLQEWEAARVAEYLDITPEQVYRIKYNVLQIVRARMAPYLDA